MKPVARAMKHHTGPRIIGHLEQSYIGGSDCEAETVEDSVAEQGTVLGRCEVGGHNHRAEFLLGLYNDEAELT